MLLGPEILLFCKSYKIEINSLTWYLKKSESLILLSNELEEICISAELVHILGGVKSKKWNLKKKSFKFILSDKKDLYSRTTST